MDREAAAAAAAAAERANNATAVANWAECWYDDDDDMRARIGWPGAGEKRDGTNLLSLSL